MKKKRAAIYRMLWKCCYTMMHYKAFSALIYPDFDDAFAHGMNNDAITQAMEENRIALNAELPAYSQITRVKIYPEEFEKTPKKSIKRFLYQEVK